MSTSSESTNPELGRRDERLGDRFNRKLSEQRLAEAFEAAGVDGPMSIGLLEIESEGLPAASVTSLGSSIVRRIGGQLPSLARLASAMGSRFVIALPGQPLLEALLSIDRLRDALECETWPLDEDRISLRFGAGVATRRSEDEPMNETFAAAERSLEQARRLVVRRHASPAQNAPAAPGPSQALSPWPSRPLARSARRVAPRSSSD